jgi:hypothetical protein
MSALSPTQPEIAWTPSAQQYGPNVNDAPVELIALIDDDGRMSARRDGEPSFIGVQSVADAIMSALRRGVDLVVPRELFNQSRGDFPPDLPPYIKIR